MQDKQRTMILNKAISLLEQGQSEAAINQYKTLLQQDENDIEALMMLGTIYGATGMPEEGIKHLEKSVEIQSDLYEAHLDLGNLYRMLGKFNIAIPHLEKATQNKETSANAWTTLSGIYGLLGDFTQAEFCCNSAIEADSRSTEAYINLANIHITQNKFREAIHLLEKLLGFNPDEKEALLIIARQCLRINDNKMAEHYAAKLIPLRADHVEAHFILGNALQNQGEFDHALEYYTRTVALDPNHAEAHERTGVIHQTHGDNQLAIAEFERSIQIKPEQPMTLYNIGVILLSTKNHDAAAYYFQQVISLRTDFVPAYNKLGIALKHLQKFDDAITFLKKGMNLAEKKSPFYYLLSDIYLENGYPDSALAFNKKAMELGSNNPEFIIQFASIQEYLGDYNQSFDSYNHAAEIEPSNTQAIYGQGISLIKQGLYHKASPYFEKALTIDSSHHESLLGLANCHLTNQKPDAALSYANRANKAKPNDTNIIAFISLIYDQMGDYRRAQKILEPYLKDNQNEINIILAFASIAKKIGRVEEAISQMEALLKTKTLSTSAQCNLHFNLGRLYDGINSYDMAFKHYEKGNLLKGKEFDTGQHNLEIDSLIKACNRQYFNTHPVSDIQSNQPVFIVGMPRSGTSLVEQILASHPDITGAGELPHIIQLTISMHTMVGADKPYPQCLKLLPREKLNHFAKQYLTRLSEGAHDSLRITDKMPGNFLHLGLIQQLFPKARIIHCIRNPIDTCLSCYFQNFSKSHDYSYDLATLGAFHRSYQKVMQHWLNTLSISMMQIEYENLVSNQEKYSKALIDFCGLKWDEKCMDFYKTKRFIGTASYAQVTEPMYSSSVMRGANYEKHIQSLVKALNTPY